MQPPVPGEAPRKHLWTHTAPEVSSGFWLGMFCEGRFLSQEGEAAFVVILASSYLLSHKGYWSVIG